MGFAFTQYVSRFTVTQKSVDISQASRGAYKKGACIVERREGEFNSELAPLIDTPAFCCE